MPPAATSIGVRLNILTQTNGPFIFESLRYLPDAALRVSDQFHITVGGSGRRQGYAVYSPYLALKAGQYRVRYRITLPNDIDSGPLMDLDVAVEDKPSIDLPRGIRAPAEFWAMHAIIAAGGGLLVGRALHRFNHRRNLLLN